MSVNVYDKTTGELIPVSGTKNHLSDGMVAKYESSSTASRPHAIGEQFIYNSKLYTATAAIAVNDTIMPETNCIESDSLADQLKSVTDVLGKDSHNFLGTLSEWNALSLAEKVKYDTVDIAPGDPSPEPSPTPTPPQIAALEFSSDDAFTLSVADPYWNGTMEYSTDGGETWSTWNGSQLSGTAEQSICVRGSNNTIVTSNRPWTFTGKYCLGNIETLLDYQTVENDQHPTMANVCFEAMFKDCASLVKGPDLLATTFVNSCYAFMFQNCTSLTEAPELSAVTLAPYCCQSMFEGCTALTEAPSLPAVGSNDNSITRQCYERMFYGCTSLTTLPELPATVLGSSAYYRMFKGCSSLKLSASQTEECQYAYRIPTSGNTTIVEHALDEMFTNTGGSFTGTPTINTTYYTDHEPV